MINLRERLVKAGKSLAANRGILMERYEHLHRRDRLAMVRRVKQERSLLLSAGEACQLLACLKATDGVEGDVAELGVAYGASAKLLAMQMPPGKRLLLFDTFDGLPAPTSVDGTRFSEGEFKTTLDYVRQYVGTDRVEYYQGLFPATAEPLSDRRFSFVHLDADLYDSTMSALEFFYARLLRGGMILCHDYPSASGVVKAYEDFFRDRTDPVIELTGYQILMVKL
jgi:O-methyltransferase